MPQIPPKIIIPLHGNDWITLDCKPYAIMADWSTNSLPYFFPVTLGAIASLINLYKNVKLLNLNDNLRNWVTLGWKNRKTILNRCLKFQHKVCSDYFHCTSLVIYHRFLWREQLLSYTNKKNTNLSVDVTNYLYIYLYEVYEILLMLFEPWALPVSFPVSAFMGGKKFKLHYTDRHSFLKYL